jgi:hypothetical protein
MFMEARMSDDMELVAAIFELRGTLPGWWFRVGECAVSCDATVGPDAFHVPEPLLSKFDAGFDCDLRQPSSMAQALRGATRMATEALEAFKAEAEAPEMARDLLPSIRRALRFISKEPAEQLIIQPIGVLQQMKMLGFLRVAAQRETPQGMSEKLVLSATGNAVLALLGADEEAP